MNEKLLSISEMNYDSLINCRNSIFERYSINNNSEIVSYTQIRILKLDYNSYRILSTSLGITPVEAICEIKKYDKNHKLTKDLGIGGVYFKDLNSKSNFYKVR